MKRLTPWLRGLVTLLLIGWVLSRVDLPELFEMMQRASVSVLLLALLLALLDRVVMVAKWLPLLKVQLPEVGWWPATRVYMASTFAGLFMPSIAADVLRGVALGRGRKAVPEIGASIALERMLGMLGGSLLSGLALYRIAQLKFSLDTRGILPWGWIATLVPPAIVIASFAFLKIPALRALINRRAGIPGMGLVRRFSGAYELYSERGRLILVVWLASAFEQTLPIWIYLMIAKSMGGTITAEMLWIAIPLMLFAARLPFTLWGLGVAEGGIIYLLGLFGVPSSEALALVLIGRVVELVAILPGGLMWSDLARRRALE